ncbi:MAG: hypothetical protein ACI9DK_001551 [Vicingaceae bacterium]|jgi:hypothetical protein
MPQPVVPQNPEIKKINDLGDFWQTIQSHFNLRVKTTINRTVNSSKFKTGTSYIYYNVERLKLFSSDGASKAIIKYAKYLNKIGYPDPLASDNAIGIVVNMKSKVKAIETKLDSSCEIGFRWLSHTEIHKLAMVEKTLYDHVWAPAAYVPPVIVAPSSKTSPRFGFGGSRGRAGENGGSGGSYDQERQRIKTNNSLLKDAQTSLPQLIVEITEKKHFIISQLRKTYQYYDSTPPLSGQIGFAGNTGASYVQ